jgi:protocatechuate 3,4-dioxygenase beta subunit
MEEPMKANSRTPRREFLLACSAVSLSLALPPENLVHARELPATRSCSDGDEVTPKQMEGPFFKPRSPERRSLLEPGIAGGRIELSGLVLSTRCQPIAGALLDFWQCDDSGDYDNSGFRLRGHQFTDGDGRYSLETIIPGLYPGRTRHIHVKLQAPDRPVLTTQLYFPGESRNQEDFLFRRELLMTLGGEPTGRVGHFDFVLKVA